MLKITQNVQPWEFCARIANADGGKVEGIEINCFYEEFSPVVEQSSEMFTIKKKYILKGDLL